MSDRLESAGDAEEAAPAPRRLPRGVKRVGALVLFFSALVVVARLTGLTEDLSVEGLRRVVESSGACGRLVYVACFCVGYLITVPGMLFVLAGVAAYGPIDGGLFAYAAALLAISCNFWAGRWFGGQDLSEIRWGFVQKLLAHLHDRPVRTVALLRLPLMLTPPLDYGLGLSNITYGRYLLGSALGLAPPILAAVLLFDRLIQLVP